MSKKSFLLSEVYRLLEPQPVVLVTTGRAGRANITPMSWHKMMEFGKGLERDRPDPKRRPQNLSPASVTNAEVSFSAAIAGDQLRARCGRNAMRRFGRPDLRNQCFR